MQLRYRNSNSTILQWISRRTE